MGIVERLNRLHPSGREGFEGLLQQLLQKVTGYRFYLARSGSQFGRDLGGRLRESFAAVECKRYSDATPFDDRQLLGSMEQAARHARELGLWLLASTRDVPDQLVQELDACGARLGIDVRVLSARGKSRSNLLILCAAFPETTLSFFDVSHQERALLEAELTEIRGAGDFVAALDEIRATIDPANWGFERWRTHQNAWTVSRFQSEAASRSAFFQPLDVSSGRETVVPRTAALQRLDDWWSGWPDRTSKLALLGQEGDGKSWAVASWLSSKLETEPAFPPVVFVASTAAVEREPLELIAETIKVQLGDAATDWPRRLQRWLSGRPAPVMILILDGINEGSRPTEHWIHLLQRLADPSLASRIAILVTCRPESWNSSFGQVRHLGFEEWFLEPLSDQEIGPALEANGIKPNELEPAILDLMRKPRYLQLVARHIRRLDETGDFTIPRLIYEDWRDRWSRKTDLVDPGAFEQMLKDLARRYRGRQTHVTLQEVTSALPGWTSRLETVKELVETGALEPQGGRFVVDQRRLELGLGLLLADDLQVRAGQGEQPDEVIASWLEPHSDIDIKARISEFAALSALQATEYPLQVSAALLYSWLGNRNMDPESQSRFSGYFPLNPDAHVALAERVWRQTDDVRSIQDVQMRTFRRWIQSPTAHQHYRRMFKRWLGFVHPDGARTNVPDQARDRHRARYAERVAEAESGSGAELRIAGQVLIQVEDPALLRLGRVSLALISHVDRKPFIDCLLAGVVADALMEWSLRDELTEWVVRSALDTELTTHLEETIREFVAQNTVVSHRAADELIDILGTKGAIAMRVGLRHGLSEPPPEFESGDPCMSWRRWSLEDCVACPERADVPAHIIAQQLQKRCSDPTFTPSTTAVARVRELAESVDAKLMCAATGHTPSDRNLELAEPILCRGHVDTIRRTVDKVFKTGFSRTGRSLLQFILLFCRENSLLMGDDHWQRAEACWRVLTTVHQDDVEASRAESFLFGLLLPRWPAHVQMARLLERPAGDSLADWQRQFRPLSDWRGIPGLLASEISVEGLRRLMWFVGAHPTAIPAEAVAAVANYLSHNDSFLRSLVLKIMVQSPHSKSQLAALAASGWAWSPTNHPDENHWGSIALARATPLSYADIRRRVWPAYLGLAVEHHGLLAEDVDAYGEDLDEVWTALPKIAPALPLTLPQMRMSLEQDSVFGSRPKVGISDEEFSRTIHFRSSDTFWGGTLDEDGTEAMGSVFGGVSDEELESRQTAMGNALRQQWEVGNIWFGQRFAHEGLSEVLCQRPDLLERWSKPLLEQCSASEPYPRLVSSFYEALARAALEVNPRIGAKLIQSLESAEGTIQTVWAETKHRVLDFWLFRCEPSLEREDVWRERFKTRRSDAELFSLVLAAEAGGAAEWFHYFVESMLESERPMDRAVGMTVAGFSASAEAGQLLDSAAEVAPEGWMRRVAEKARDRWSSNQRARHWFRQFADAQAETEAWAGFRLFLREVDSRFWWWSADQLKDGRDTFLGDNHGAIGRAIKQNEKSLAKSYAGQMVLERECEPWMH